MRIEVKGDESILEQLRLQLEDQLQKNGYSKGPKIGAMDSGVMIDYVKEDRIVSIHLSEEENEQCTLGVEVEDEFPELSDLWDDALISYAKVILNELRSFAIKKERFERELP